MVHQTGICKVTVEKGNTNGLHWIWGYARWHSETLSLNTELGSTHSGGIQCRKSILVTIRE